MLLPSARPLAETNNLLSTLSTDDITVLASAIRTARPGRGAVLCSRTERATDVWFPKGGIISLAFTDNEGRSVQTGIVGREGCTGVEALFTDVPPLAEAIVLIEAEMMAIPAAHLRSAMQARPSIHYAVSKFLYSMAAQSLQTVACNRLHSLEARCCRWLLMTWDRTGEDNLPLTQEGLATMLGSGRPRINVLLAALEQDGLLHRSRGRIRLLSRQKLEQRTCECYRLLGYMANSQSAAATPTSVGAPQHSDQTTNGRSKSRR